MKDQTWISLPSDACGESALDYINRSDDAAECMIMAGGAQRVDAFTGTALRATIEHHGRVRQKRVVFGPPRDVETARLLAGMLDNDLPGHFCLSNDASVEEYGEPPRNIILPSTVVRNSVESDLLADTLIGRGSGYPRRPVRFLAGALATFAEAAVDIGTSAIGVVCTVIHDRHADSLQLVSIDFGIASRDMPSSGGELESMTRETDELENLERLTAQGERLGLDLSLLFAAGAGRIRATPADIGPSDGRYVEGFTSAVEIRL